jgi:glycogen debranching enzyme
VPGLSDGAFGFYAEDTRFLRRLELHLDGRRPLLLNATIGGESWQSAIDLTNADVVERGRVVVPSRTFRISRRLTVFDGRLYQVVVIESFARQAHEVTLSWDFGADFVDVFEVRGHRRLERGTVQTPRLESSAIDLSYCGRDGVVRTTRLDFEPPPAQLESARALYKLQLDPHGSAVVALSVSAAAGLPPQSRPLPWNEALTRRSAVVDSLRRD